MALTAYYDASGREESSAFLCVAGAVATQENWREFEREWRAILDGEGVREFHHTDFKGSHGEFRAWRGDEPRRRRFLTALIDVLERRLACWHSSGIHPRTFALLSEEFDISVLGGPYMVSAAWAKTVVDWWRDRTHPGEPISHVFEKGDSGQRPHRRLEDLGGDVSAMEKVTLERGYIYAFQAADLIAGELSTLQGGMQHDDKKRIGRVPLVRIFQIPGRIVNADYGVLARVCRQFPSVFPPLR